MSNSGLQQFDGNEVIATTVAITNAGDGLSKALKVKPQEMHHGETVFVVLECEVSKVTFVRADPDAGDDLIRVHSLRAGLATLVDQELVSGVLSEQRRILDEAKGIQTLPGLGDGDEPEADEGDLDSIGSRLKEVPSE